MGEVSLPPSLSFSRMFFAGVPSLFTVPLLLLLVVVVVVVTTVVLLEGCGMRGGGCTWAVPGPSWGACLVSELFMPPPVVVCCWRTEHMKPCEGKVDLIRGRRS